MLRRQTLIITLSVAAVCLGFVAFLVARQSEARATECGKWEELLNTGFEEGTTGGLANAIAATSKDDVWIVGQSQTRGFGITAFSDSTANQPLIMHWDGNTMKTISLSDLNIKSNDAGLEDVAAVSANDVWAIGYYHVQEQSGQEQYSPLILHWDSKAWSLVPNPQISWPGSTGYYGSGPGLNAIKVISKNNIWIVGNNKDETLIEHWDGSQLQIVPSPNIGTGSNWLRALAVITPDDIWALGGYRVVGGASSTQYELFLHWNGREWSIADNSKLAANGHEIFSLSASGQNDAWAVGDDFSVEQMTLIEHWDGKNWNPVGSPNPSQHENLLTAVLAISPTNAWAVGEKNLEEAIVFHWDGKEWSEVDAPRPFASQRLRDLEAVAPGEIWTAGYYAPGGDIWEYVPNPLVARYVECPGTGGMK